MEFYESPSNTAARRSSGAERSRWRDAGVDPELLDCWPTPEVTETTQTDAQLAIAQDMVRFSLNPETD